MPTAICKTCHKTRNWRNRRGVRLADLRCECGGELTRARHFASCKQTECIHPEWQKDWRGCWDFISHQKCPEYQDRYEAY